MPSSGQHVASLHMFHDSRMSADSMAYGSCCDAVIGACGPWRDCAQVHLLLQQERLAGRIIGML